MSENNSNGAVEPVEEWKDVSGYEGYYQVSNMGRVRSVNRVVKYKDGRVFKYTGMILKATISKCLGYRLVGLSVNSNVRDTYVHLLVLDAFVPKPTSSEVEANHKNGIKSDNQVGNLEWVTHKENMIHSIKTGLRKIFDCGRGKGRTRRRNPYAK